MKASGLLWHRAALPVGMALMISILPPNALAITYPAALFNLQSMIGKTFQAHDVGSGTETLFYSHPNPVPYAFDEVGTLHVVPISETIDGFPANARVWIDGVRGVLPGTDLFISNTEGIIDFGNKPTGNNVEHFDNGRTMVPSTMAIGATTQDLRISSWHGQWEGGELWAGDYVASWTVHGFEPIALPTGTVDALRVDLQSNRTKVGVSGSQWATEAWNESFWLVEGSGLVRIYGEEFKQIFRTDFNSGSSPVYESFEQSTMTLAALAVPEPSTRVLLGFSLATVFGWRYFGRARWDGRRGRQRWHAVG